ncbi:2-(1,2-epoxy-1,2-dihydrophenyl)acetyl-CoA isomerase [Enhydrobacter aerosaccus]|uniref:2-(1,2-epoxy-1,2-dihydrophenyl)acetyl-CoA isomerase n=1 Tax=Enhydrobacter aerosaccus TaxID=225324 RepID=A0A1T4RYW0_9HYPH|nr:enoyl-CoA hydratase [Enhydrobacter aerosaccus]SKA21046.1 2-(1,2-epoxy-1,2-dihydrophenyl)acetyl-CoA isomerase [Enhydrobacter aerosaccus]
MSAPHVLAEVKDGIGWLTLNRPESLNALSFEMTDLLIKHTAEFEKDPAVRCVVIRGAGTHFMAGGDIKGFHKSLTENKAVHLAGFEMRVVKAHQTIYQIRRMAKPVLASVQGAAAGFGLSLILACDLAIAADDAFFTLAYRHIGLSADGGATYFLPRIVGERKALEIALLGERFTAQEAKGQNILNWIVPKDQLAAETEKMARRLADGPTIALATAKRLIRNSFDNSWDEHSHREAEGLAACAATEDHFEGLNAFLEKRKPHFKGR